MAANLKVENCKKLGFPEPKSFHTEKSYVKEVMLNGQSLNTRQARFIGIFNLHSTASTLSNRQKLQFERDLIQVVNPATGTTPKERVLSIRMTQEQIEEHKKSVLMQKQKDA